MYRTRIYSLCVLLVLSTTGFAQPDNTQLAVWANEAIVATYTFNYENFLSRQRDIAKYFTAAGWTAYSTALHSSKLPEVVKKNYYAVSAVATLPPTIKTINATQWEATMPLLVLYKNPQYQQKQDLLVTINFVQAPSGQGVRGLAIASLQSKVTKPPCVCQPQSEEDTTTNDKQ